MGSKSWFQIRERLKDSLPSHIFSSLVETTSCFENDDLIELSFPNRFTKESFEEKCLSPMRSVLSDLDLSSKRVDLSIIQSGNTKPENPYISQSTFNPFDPK